jgi:hypothetical protein
MKYEAEIRSEQRYWEGKLEGLQTGGGGAPSANVIEARAWVAALGWVLSPPDGGVRTELKRKGFVGVDDE